MVSSRLLVTSSSEPDLGQWYRELSSWARRRRLDVILLRSVESTHQLALGLLDDNPGYDDLHAWIFALEQRRGRGRLLRSWASPYGAGVYATFVRSVPRAQLAGMPLLVAVALCEALETLGFSCGVKWPNDLQLQGAKLGGILLQSRGGGERVALVAGFGLNRSHSVAELPRVDCTSLALAGAGEPPALAVLSTALADAVDRELERQLGAGAAATEELMARYVGRSVHTEGDPLTISEGEREWQGRFHSFTSEGHLRLRLANGTVRDFANGSLELG